MTLMMKEYFRIKDNCRKGLLKYLEKAFSLIPAMESPKILDIGCGTGVPTLWMAENYGGITTAIDTDKNALAWLQEKILNKSLEREIYILNISFFDFKSGTNYFDIILAEGFLNIIGFERGFPEVIRMLRKGGHFIIHDEYKDHEKKCDFISKNSCILIGTLFLNENVWWNDYYKQLENAINAVTNKQAGDLFKADLEEIESCKSDPAPFRSIYYIVKKL